MTSKLYTLIFSLFICLSANTQLDAQKFGHMNSGNLLEMMPEVKAGDAELEVLRKSLFDKIQTRVKALEEKFERLRKKAAEGGMSPVQQREAEDDLNRERESILKEEQALTQTMQQKRVDLLQPIFDKVNKAIEEVGKENGYTMIFETSQFNAILFAAEADDVTDMVKAKLGL